MNNNEIIPGVKLASRAMAAKYFNVNQAIVGSIINKNFDHFVELGMRDYTEEALLAMGFEKKTRTRFKKDGALVQLESGGGTVTLLNEKCMDFLEEQLKSRAIAKHIMDNVGEAAEVNEDAATDEEVEINDERFQVFSNPEFGDIRTIVIDGEPWFVGNDVSALLGYSNVRKAVPDHVDDDDKQRTQIRYAGQLRDITIINESGLYSLILSSKLPEAKKFKRWVTSEVLPSIRKHGAYMTTETLMEAMKNPDYVFQIVKELSDEQQKRIELEKKNSVLAEANSILAQENLTWGDREILNSIVRKVACWFYPGNSLDKAVRFMWNSLYKDVMYKYHFNLRGKLDKASPEQLAKAVSVLVAKCMDVDIDLSNIIGYTNAMRVVNRYREESSEA